MVGASSAARSGARIENALSLGYVDFHALEKNRVTQLSGEFIGHEARPMAAPPHPARIMLDVEFPRQIVVLAGQRMERRNLIGERLRGAARFEDEHAEAGLGQICRHRTAAAARADDNEVLDAVDLIGDGVGSRPRARLFTGWRYA